MASTELPCRVFPAGPFSRRSLKLPLVFVVVLLVAAICGCRSDTSNPPAVPAVELTVAAAADLHAAFTEIGKAFEQQANCRVLLSFGSTGQLAQQIEHGAPFDVFAAANVSYLDGLRAKNLIVADSQQLYARGRIVLVTSKKSGVHATRLADLLGSEIKYIAIANPGHAPYGLAARQALEQSGLWSQLEPKIVLGENVRQARQYVLTGNTEAGIIALSIAQQPDLEFTLIDDSLHEPLDQALAIVADSKQQPLARQFIAFLNGPAGRPTMKKYGFLLPDEFDDAKVDPAEHGGDGQRIGVHAFACLSVPHGWAGVARTR